MKLNHYSVNNLPVKLASLVFVLTVLLVGCGDEGGGDDGDMLGDASDMTSDGDVADQLEDVPNDGGDVETDGVEDTDTGGGCQVVATPNPQMAVDTEVVTLGTFPNAIAIDGDAALVVNSGDNAIQRYETSDPDGTSDGAFIDVGIDQNPYDVAVFGDRIYVTNNLGNTLTVADNTGAIISTTALAEFSAPQDIIATENYLLVANTEFTFPAPEERFGSILVLSRQDNPAVLNRIDTTQSNPQNLLLRGGELIAINSGATSFDMATGLVTPDGPGGVDVFPLATIETASAPESNTAIPAMGLVGNPGVPALVDDSLYIGSGTAPVLFKVAADGTLERGSTNPVTLFDAGGANALVAPFAGPGDVLYVLDFNNDAMHLFDPTCNMLVGEPIELGTNAEMLEGPLQLDWDGDTAHVVMSVSAAVTTVNAAALTE